MVCCHRLGFHLRLVIVPLLELGKALRQLSWHILAHTLLSGIHSRREASARRTRWFGTSSRFWRSATAISIRRHAGCKPPCTWSRKGRASCSVRQYFRLRS